MLTTCGESLKCIHRQRIDAAKNMKIRNGYCITYEYSATTPTIISTHRTLADARDCINRRRASLCASHPSIYPTGSVFSLALRELIDGDVGEIIEDHVGHGAIGGDK